MRKRLLYYVLAFTILVMLLCVPGIALASDGGATDAGQITDIAYLATNAGAIVLVTGIVQVLKVSSAAISGSTKIRIIVWVLSFAVLFTANWAIAGMLTGGLVLKCLANSVLVALGCFGAYNVAIEQKAEE